MKNASSTGKMFYETHDQHLNLDEFFAARAKAKCEKEIKVLESTKQATLKQKKQADATRVIIETKGQPASQNCEHKFQAPDLVALASWKIGKTAKRRKEELLKTHWGHPAPEKNLTLSNADESNLQQLETAKIGFKDTALDIALNPSANAVKTNAQQGSDSAANELMQALHSCQQAQTTILPGSKCGGNM